MPPSEITMAEEGPEQTSHYWSTMGISSIVLHTPENNAHKELRNETPETSLQATSSLKSNQITSPPRRGMNLESPALLSDVTVYAVPSRLFR